MLKDVWSIAGEDDTGRVTAAVADAESSEWRVEEGDVGAGDGLGNGGSAADAHSEEINPFGSHEIYLEMLKYFRFVGSR